MEKIEKVVRVSSPIPSTQCSPKGSLSSEHRGELEAAVHSLAAAHVDDEPPYHVFSRTTVILIVAMVSLTATFSPLSTSIYFPAQPQIAKDLGITAETVNLSITTYMIGQALAPSFWGPIADVIGRRQILMYTLAVYVGANIGLALTENAAMLMVFRFIQAWGSSSTISVGAGVISDLTPPSKRGGYLGMFAGTRQFSTAFAPVLGGLLAGFLGFRSIFWFLTILSAFVLIVIIVVLPETQRRIAGNGSVPLKSFMYRPLAYSCLYRQKQNNKDPETPEEAEKMGLKPYDEAPKLTWKSFFEPMLFLFEKDVACALFFGACVYTAWSMVTATTAQLFAFHYGFNTIQIGLCFLANGVGCVLGSIYSGRALNANFQKEGNLWQYSTNVKHNTPLPRHSVPLEFPLERARLGDVPLYSVICIVSLLIYGWSLMPFHGVTHDNNVHIIVPLAAQFALGFAATAVLNGNNTLTIDLWPQKSASATAINNFARCSMGAVGVSVADVLLEAVHSGFMFTILAGLVLVGTLPIMAQWIHGKRWRAERASRIASRAASKAASRANSRSHSPIPSRSKRWGSTMSGITAIGSRTPELQIKGSRTHSEAPTPATVGSKDEK